MTSLFNTKSQSSRKNTPSFSLLFRLLIWWRIIYGILRVIFGIVLFKWATIDPSGLFYRLISHEIVEDPGDLFILMVSPIVEHLSTGTIIFIALYLIFWGMIETILAINILRYKLWAFPTALVLIGVFVLYEIYRITYTQSLFLLFIIIFDIFVIWLINKEYRTLKDFKD